MDARTDRSLQAELEEAYALLDVIFARAPVGLALFDADLRYARVNDRMAAINGLAAAAHLGRTVREVLPNVAPDVEDDLRRVLRTGEPLIEVERSGETPARPGHEREWLELLLAGQPARRRDHRHRRRRLRGHRPPQGPPRAALPGRSLRGAAAGAVGGRTGHGRGRGGRPLRLRQRRLRADLRLHVPGADRARLAVRARRPRRSRRGGAPRRAPDRARLGGHHATRSRCAAATARSSSSRSPECRWSPRSAASSSCSCATSPSAAASRPSASGCSRGPR